MPGRKITATVTATNDGGIGHGDERRCGPCHRSCGSSAGALFLRSNSAAPAISGTPQVGDTLVVTNGTWSGDTPINFFGEVV